MYHIESLHYWQDRLNELDIEHGGITQYAGREALQFEDPDGLRLVLLNNKGQSVPPEWAPWPDAPVPVDQQILGMGPVEMTVRRPEKLAKMLEELFDYVEVDGDVRMYQSVSGAVHGEIIIKEQAGDNERPGRGSVHHLAIRAKNDAEIEYWAERVKARGFHSTRILDRFYFKSLYFRESNGILFEIATDGPGFTVDSSVDQLGQALNLPPFLEAQRTKIEANLTPLD